MSVRFKKIEMKCCNKITIAVSKSSISHRNPKNGATPQFEHDVKFTLYSELINLPKI